jgi:hypothetical protein
MNILQNATHADGIIHNTLKNGLPFAKMTYFLAEGGGGSIADGKSAERFVHKRLKIEKKGF